MAAILVFQNNETAAENIKYPDSGILLKIFDIDFRHTRKLPKDVFNLLPLKCKICRFCKRFGTCFKKTIVCNGRVQWERQSLDRLVIKMLFKKDVKRVGNICYSVVSYYHQGYKRILQSHPLPPPFHSVFLYYVLIEFATCVSS